MKLSKALTIFAKLKRTLDMVWESRFEDHKHKHVKKRTILVLIVGEDYEQKPEV